MLRLIISLVAGAIGGNLAGSLLKNLNQGTLLNSIAGIFGGGRVSAGNSWASLRGELPRVAWISAAFSRRSPVAESAVASS